MFVIGVWSVVFLITCLPIANGTHDAKRLHNDLIGKNNYNKLVSPNLDNVTKTEVKLGMKLVQLQDVDEKNQMITLNMWLIHEWTDHRLVWKPEDYGNITEMYMPPELIWIPDILLYNAADGGYTMSIMTKASLNYNGSVSWQPPVSFKSSCEMNMEFFPFDDQECHLKLGPWTYGDALEFDHMWMREHPNLGEFDVLKNATDMQDFYRSVEWDIMAFQAQKFIQYYPCCPNVPYPHITFTVTLRRKTLYFTYSLIIPCVSINMLTILTFYLPSDSGNKISLCISIFLSLFVFQVLLMDLTPPSKTVPLLGKFLVFTMILISLSVFVSVVTVNISFRSSATHDLPKWTKKIFLQILPKLLLMRKPPLIEKTDDAYNFLSESATDLTWGNPYKGTFQPAQESDVESLFTNYSVASTFIGTQMSRFASANVRDFCYACAKRKMNSYPPSAKKALESCVFIAKHHKDEDDGNRVKEDWIYLALVLDRLFLYIFVSVMFIGALVLFLNAPSLHDGKQPIESFAHDTLKDIVSSVGIYSKQRVYKKYKPCPTPEPPFYR